MVQSLARTVALVAVVAWSARSCAAVPVSPTISQVTVSSLAPSTNAGSALQPKESGHPHRCHPPHLSGSSMPHRSWMIPEPSDIPSGVLSVPPLYTGSAAVSALPTGPSAAISKPILPRAVLKSTSVGGPASAVPSGGSATIPASSAVPSGILTAVSFTGASSTIPKPSKLPKESQDPHHCGGKEPHSIHPHESHIRSASSLGRPHTVPLGSASASAIPSTLPKRN
ncbi:hypothetical protein DFH09DRAFT_1153976 [Mycena vulgaris]|nr:hypothetical protein DFH09DRAFT_1153976 [Mycena vulgaris]